MIFESAFPLTSLELLENRARPVKLNLHQCCLTPPNFRVATAILIITKSSSRIASERVIKFAAVGPMYERSWRHRSTTALK
jgi:hypothetical protein